MFQVESDLARSLVLWHLSKEFAVNAEKKAQEKAEHEARPSWPAHRRFWHRLWPAPPANPQLPQNANAAPKASAAAASG